MSEDTDETNLALHVALDVQYTEHHEGSHSLDGVQRTSAHVAALAFRDLSDSVSALEWTADLPRVADYKPGSFYLRELPCLKTVLQQMPACDGMTGDARLESIWVDGHVWLSPNQPGLGAHLHDALQDTPFAGVPVIGVAKQSFVGGAAVEVLRGDSNRPLYVTSVGMEASDAADWVRSMHGEHRIPTLLKRVDRLARGGATPSNPREAPS